MTPEGGPAPVSLLRGFMSDVFEHQRDKRQISSLVHKTTVVRRALDANVVQVHLCLCIMDVFSSPEPKAHR